MNVRTSADTLLVQMLKGHLICNTTLAEIADRYNIPRLLIASPAAAYQTRVAVKTRGSMFESWVAGVFYSYLGQDAHTARGDPSDDPPSKARRTVHAPLVVDRVQAQESVMKGENIGPSGTEKQSEVYGANEQPNAPVDLQQVVSIQPSKPDDLTPSKPLEGFEPDVDAFSRLLKMEQERTSKPATLTRNSITAFRNSAHGPTQPQIPPCPQYRSQPSSKEPEEKLTTTLTHGSDRSSPQLPIGRSRV